MEESKGNGDMTEDREEHMKNFLRGLQKEIEERERRLYSEKTLYEAKNPKNMGKIENPDAHGIFRGTCGDTIEIFLKIEEDNIAEISFVTDGCGSTVACGSMITHMVKGNSISKAMEIERDDLINALDGLPRDNIHCAALAVGSLRKAIKSYRK